jgi:hypothetical protein
MTKDRVHPPSDLSRAENTSALDPNFPLLLQPTPVPSGILILPELAHSWQRATGSWRLQQTLMGLKT